MKCMLAVLGMVMFFTLGAFIASAAGMPEYSLQSGLVVTALSLVPTDLKGTLASTPNVAAILADYVGKNEKKIFSSLVPKMKIAEQMTVVPDLKDKMHMTKLTVKDGVVGYSENVNYDDDDIQFTGRTIESSLFMRNVKVNPLKYRTTWMAHLMKTGVNPQDLPFKQFTLDKIIAQIGSEIINNVYLADKTVAGNGIKNLIDGWGTIIGKEITDGSITPVVTGAITNSNAVASLEKVAEDFPSQYLEDDLTILQYISYDTFRKYQNDYRERYGKYTARNEKGLYELDGFAGKFTMLPVSWMGKSQRIITTPYENMIFGVDSLSDFNNIYAETEFELLKLKVLFQMGCQIRDVNAVRTNDQV